MGNEGQNKMDMDIYLLWIVKGRRSKNGNTHGEEIWGWGTAGAEGVGSVIWTHLPKERGEKKVLLLHWVVASSYSHSQWLWGKY